MSGAVNVVVAGLVVVVISVTLERRCVPIEVCGIVELWLVPLDTGRRIVRLVMSRHVERWLRRIDVTGVMACMMAAVNHDTVLSLSFTAKTEREYCCQGDDGQYFFGDRNHDWNLFSAGDFVGRLH